MKKLIICTVAAGALLFIFSCKKNDSGGQTNMQLITAAAWKYDTAAIDLNLDGTAETALPPGIIESCDEDNIVTLKDDGTGTVDEGASKCDPGDPQSVAITWTFKNNETVINIPDTIFGNISGDAQIKALTATKLTLLKQVTVDLGIPTNVNVIIDLKH